MTLIARDIAKLRVKLVQQDSGGIWSEVKNPAYSPVLRKPNAYQTRIQFWESWILSKLCSGNAYIMKVRDGRGVVTELHVLDPQRVKPLVAESGDVFYEINRDNLTAQKEAVVVPAREIIHDRFNALFHPLVGLSPLFANGLAATQGLKIQENSANFFANQSVPSGILTAPGAISDDTAQRLKDTWEGRYSGGRGAGKIAVLGDGLEFKGMTITATDAELVDQLKWTAEVVCSTFHVPKFKLGIGDVPANSTVESLNIQYYSDCLQSMIEEAETSLDEGLGMDGVSIGVEFEVENLWRMDTATQMDVLEKAKSVLTLDERRAKLDRSPVTGGGTIYLQQQDHSIEAIAARDKLLIEQADRSDVQEEPDLAEDTGKAVFSAIVKASVAKRMAEKVAAA